MIKLRFLADFRVPERLDRRPIVFLLKNRNILIAISYTIENPPLMKTYLGELEELVLLTIVALGDQAYGVSIQQDLEQRCDRAITIGALHATIARLEEKGFLQSWMGGATAERGGRSKRFYEITQSGRKAVTEVKLLRDELWQLAKLKLQP